MQNKYSQIFFFKKLTYNYTKLIAMWFCKTANEETKIVLMNI